MNVEAVAAARRSSPAFFTRQAWVLCDLHDGHIMAAAMDVNSIRRFLYGAFIEAGGSDSLAREKAHHIGAHIRTQRMAQGRLT